MQKTEMRFASTEAGGVVFGPVALALQGDVPKRRFNLIVTNFGRESGDENMVFKAQQATSADGSFADCDAGSVTVTMRCQETYEFFVEGTNTHWQLYATGETEGMFQIVDNDVFANSVVAP